MKKKITLGLKGLNPIGLVKAVVCSITALTGNPRFPSPTPPLDVMQAKVDIANAAIAAYEAAKSAMKLALAKRNDALGDLRSAYELQAAYVADVTGGEETAVVSAALRVRAKATPVSMSQVRDLRLAPGDKSGEMLARWKPIPGVRMYQVQTCTDPEAQNWQPKLYSSKAKCTLNHDLVPGSKVWVRVKALGTRNEGPWSNASEKIVI